MRDDDTAPAGRVLLVEDDEATAKMMGRILAGRGGFNVGHAANAAAALDMARAETWDLVLTDIEMPGMTGIELLGEIKRISQGVPVAVITGRASVDDAVRAIRSGADDFIEKPARADDVIAMARTLVAKGRAARAARSVLAIGAHPDDVEIGAAGTLLAHRRRGDTVSILTLCPGGPGAGHTARSGESRQAARILDAELFLEDLPDTRISEADPTIATISRVVEQVQPAVVYVHSIHDVHQDHRNTHRAAMVAVRGVGDVYCFQSPSATVDFRPTRFVTIDEYMDRKQAAISAFTSQAEMRAYLEPDLVSSTARYWSRHADGQYAEAFEVIRVAADVAGKRSVQEARHRAGPPGRTPYPSPQAHMAGTNHAFH